MALGSYIGFNESLEKEFKELTVKIDIEAYFEREKIVEIVKTGIVDGKSREIFNNMILDVINHYFKFYVPKYLSAFGNSELDYGELYIGINDLGEITGIPYFGELDHAYLKELMRNIIPFTSYDMHSEEIEFEIVKVLTDGVLFDIDDLRTDIDEVIERFERDKLEYEAMYKTYCKTKMKWFEKVMEYSVKIEDFVRVPKLKEELTRYVIEKGGLPEVIHDIETTTTLGLTEEFGVKDRKLDPTDIVYWITNYKDEKLFALYDIKPTRPPMMIFNDSFYLVHFSLLSGLRKKLLLNVGSGKLNYFYIKIKMPTKVLSRTGHEVFYRNLGEDGWICKTRCLVGGEPGCE